MPTETGPSDRIKAVKDRLSAYESEFGINHKPRAIRWVKDRAKYLRQHLGNALVADLTKERIVDYMVARRAEAAGNRTIPLNPTLQAAIDAPELVQQCVGTARPAVVPIPL